MSNRKLLLLTAVFLFLLGFVVLFERHQPTSEEAAKAKKKLVDFKPEEVASILVERPDLPKVEVKRQEGSRWSLAANPPGPADGPTADALAADLSRLELLGEPTTSFDPKEYGLDVPKATATVALKSGAKKVIRFGKEIPGTDTTAAEEEGRFGAVKFAPMASLSKPVDEFRAKTLIEVPASEVTRVVLTKGQSQVVVSREKPGAEWKLEAPVKDLASQTFVEQLLNDLAGSRISEFPAVAQTDYARVGLSPANAVLVAQKGSEVVSNVSFGAAKAEASGKIYVKRNDVVALADDRLQEDLAKELGAFRETKLCPIDTFAVTRVTVDTGEVRTGAERVENEWTSAGRKVSSNLVEDLLDKIAHADSKGFVPKKDYAARGVGGPKGKKPAVLATVELTKEKETAPRTLTFLAMSPGNGPSLVAVEVTSRGDAVLVDRAVFDDLAKLVSALRDAATGPLGAPVPPPGKKAPAKASTPAPAPKATPTP
ncbi:MAG TPA: DUF4340 domain-containing protein [Thermoanaerobaculia bacterium]|nr:DUF4340 domain-containing protein [Thermoanaerobaculia bacterium]